MPNNAILIALCFRFVYTADMKKIFQTFLVVLLVGTIFGGLSACGNNSKDPIDKPFIKSQSSSLNGNTVSYNLTIVNPTNKTLIVSIWVSTKYSSTLLNGNQTASDWQSNPSTTFEIAPNATLNKTVSGTFPSGTFHWEHRVSISSYEKMDMAWLVGKWRNANTNHDSEWVFTATTYTHSGIDADIATYGTNETWEIISNNTTLRFIKNGTTQIDRPFSVSNNNNTLILGGETYNRVA